MEKLLLEICLNCLELVCLNKPEIVIHFPDGSWNFILFIQNAAEKLQLKKVKMKHFKNIGEKKNNTRLISIESY